MQVARSLCALVAAFMAVNVPTKVSGYFNFGEESISCKDHTDCYQTVVPLYVHVANRFGFVSFGQFGCQCINEVCKVNVKINNIDRAPECVFCGSECHNMGIYKMLKEKFIKNSIMNGIDKIDPKEKAIKTERTELTTEPFAATEAATTPPASENTSSQPAIVTETAATAVVQTEGPDEHQTVTEIDGTDATREVAPPEATDFPSEQESGAIEHEKRGLGTQTSPPSTTASDATRQSGGTVDPLPTDSQGLTDAPTNKSEEASTNGVNTEAPVHVTKDPVTPEAGSAEGQTAQPESASSPAVTEPTGHTDTTRTKTEGTPVTSEEHEEVTSISPGLATGGSSTGPEQTNGAIEITELPGVTTQTDNGASDLTETHEFGTNTPHGVEATPGTPTKVSPTDVPDDVTTHSVDITETAATDRLIASTISSVTDNLSQVPKQETQGTPVSENFSTQATISEVQTNVASSTGAPLPSSGYPTDDATTGIPVGTTSNSHGNANTVDSNNASIESQRGTNNTKNLPTLESSGYGLTVVPSPRVTDVETEGPGAGLHHGKEPEVKTVTATDLSSGYDPSDTESGDDDGLQNLPDEDKVTWESASGDDSDEFGSPDSQDNGSGSGDDDVDSHAVPSQTDAGTTEDNSGLGDSDYYGFQE